MTAMTALRHQKILGGLTIAFAVAFNIPFSILGSTFEYPDVLRRPAAEVLDLFASGGASLILTWHAFALMAFLLVPLSAALSLSGDRLQRAPILSVLAAIAGGLSGLAQAIGLWRWVFVVPALARLHADPGTSAADKGLAEATFGLINQYGGVAIGEHIGQLLLCLFVLCVALMQLAEGCKVAGWLGLLTAVIIAIGTNEGLALALGKSGEVFGITTVAGFLLLSVWLVTTGIALIRAPAVNQ